MSQSNADLLRRKRDLHADIARSRHRMAGRLAETRASAREALSWRTCVARHPVWSMAAAIGVGMMMSVGIRPGKVARRLGTTLAQQAIGVVKQRLWAELQETWARSIRNR